MTRRSLKTAFLLLASLLVGAPALGQSVQQSGAVTRGHLPYWVTNGVIGDGGSSADSPVSSMGVTNNGGAGICVNSDRVTAAGRTQLCLSSQTNGPATISLQNFGTAGPQPLQFIINGTTFPFPSSLTSITVGVTPINGGTNNGLLFVQNATLANLATLNNGVLVTGPSGAPVIATSLPSGITIPSPIFSGANFITLAMLPQLNALSLWANPTGAQNNAQQVSLDPTLGFSGVTLKCSTATISQNGCGRPDGTTITINSGGQLTAVGAATTSIDAGGLTAVTNGKAGDYLFQNGSAVGHSGFPYAAIASVSGAL